MAKEKRRADIEFQAGEDAFRLVFEKSEYRAYKYDKLSEKWCDMKLGSLDPDVLKRHIIGMMEEKGG